MKLLITMALTLTAANAAFAQSSDYGMAIGLGLGGISFAMIIVFTIIYFIPTFIAFGRKHPNKWLIFLLNFVLGVTAIGWVAALIWSLLAIHIDKDGKIVNET